MTQERAKELLANFKEYHRLLPGELPYSKRNDAEYDEIMNYWLEDSGCILNWDKAQELFLNEVIRNG